MELWQLTEQDVYEHLGSSPSGLGKDEAAQRLIKYGPNVLPAKQGRPLIYRFFQQFADLFAMLLELAAALTFLAAVLSHGADRADQLHVAFAIIGVVLLNAVIGFFQEYRAEKATEALRNMVPQNAKVLRDGRLAVVPVSELVPGDVIALEEGDAISADARLVRQYEMSTNNIALTGESDAVRKTSDPITSEKLSKIDMPNLVFMGTSVAAGTGRAVVIATGMQTEFGRIFELTSMVREEKSPLQREVGVMAHTVSKIAVATGLALFGMGHFLGLELDRRRALRAGRHGGLRSRGPARHAFGRSCGGRAEHGEAKRAHQEAFGGRDSRLDKCDLHRQDRDPHQGRDDRQARYSPA